MFTVPPLALWTPPAAGGGGSTPAFVKKTAQQFYDNVTSASRTITGVTANNLLVCMLATCDQDNSPNAAVVPPPSGWSLAVSLAGPVNANSYMPLVSIYYKEGAASGSHTANFTSLRAGTYCELTIAEFSGIATSGALDKIASANSPNNTQVTSGSVTTAATAQAKELVIALGSGGGSALTGFLWPPSSGFTDIDHEPDGSAHLSYGSGYKVTSAAGAQSASWTWTGNSEFQGVIATFKGA